MTQKLMLGAVSTDAEVKALIAHYGVPEAGQVLPYEDIEVVIGVDRKKNRFRSVLTRYRQHMERLHGVHFVAMSNIGLRVLTPQERVDRNIIDAAHGMRKVRRSSERLAMVPREELDKTSAARADNAQALLAKLNQQFISGHKAIKPPSSKEQTLKIVSIGQ